MRPTKLLTTNNELMSFHLLPHDREEGWTPYAWLIYLVPFACVPAMERGTSLLEWVATIAGLVVFLALYFRGYWVRGSWRFLAIIVAITLLGTAFSPWNPGAGAFFIYAAAFAGQLSPTRRAVQVIVAIEIVIVVQVAALATPWYNACWPLIFAPLIGALCVHNSQRKLANAK